MKQIVKLLNVMYNQYNISKFVKRGHHDEKDIYDNTIS